jgi:hypothetical protein
MVMAQQYPCRNSRTLAVLKDPMRSLIPFACLLALALAGVPAAGAQVRVNLLPPGAVTGVASEVAATTATLSGQVDPNGGATTYHFEYGTTTAYGLQSGEAAAGTGTEPVDVSVPVTGLTTGTTYHFRLVATNAAGITRGADQTLQTAAAPRVATGRAIGVGTSSATLTASVDANGLPTTFRFEWGTTRAYGSSTDVTSAGAAQSAVRVQAALGSLQPFTTYHYRVTATNALGTVAGADRSVRTRRALTGLTVSAAPSPVRWAGSTLLFGRLQGAGVGLVRLAVERLDFPFTTPPWIPATVRTARDGGYRIAVGPLWATARLRLVSQTTPSFASATVQVGNRVLVGLRARRSGRRQATLSGSVNPAVPAARASLQKRSPSGRWVTVQRAGVQPLGTARSQYSFGVRRDPRRTSWRVVIVPDDGGGHLRGTSRTLRLRGAR